MKPPVGLIANPLAGTDVRRIAALGLQRGNADKVRILACVLAGLGEAGVERVLYLPDRAGLVPAALEVAARVSGKGLVAEPVGLPAASTADAEGTRLAARFMAQGGAGCIVVLGGDGTARLAALGAPDTPLLPLPGGTNNAFACPVEPTLAGLAAGRTALGLGGAASVRRAKALAVEVAGEADSALVDVALLAGQATGARAIWSLDSLRGLVACRAERHLIGLAALAARRRTVGRWAPGAVWLRFSPRGHPVRAPIAPGLFATAWVEADGRLGAGEDLELPAEGCLLALDGERARSLPLGARVHVRLAEGPLVIDPWAALAR